MSYAGSLTAEQLVISNPVQLERQPVPDVGLQPGQGEIHLYLAQLESTGTTVGETYVIFDPKGSKYLYFPTIYPANKNRGLGMAMYVRAAGLRDDTGHDLPMTSGRDYDSLCDDSRHIWEGLVRRGLAAYSRQRELACYAFYQSRLVERPFA